MIMKYPFSKSVRAGFKPSVDVSSQVSRTGAKILPMKVRSMKVRSMKVRSILVTAAIATSLSPVVGGTLWGSNSFAHAETAPVQAPVQAPAQAPAQAPVQSVPTQPTPEQPTPESIAPVQPEDAPREVDSTVSRDFKPATIYIHDPATHQLVERVAMVAADQPVVGAVTQIMNSYEGQDVGIRGYDVRVNKGAKKAEINFKVESPRGEKALQSLSSANQYAIFEAIRETLEQPDYQVRQVIFLANGKSIDI
jgi:hypothetical protein